MHKKARYADYIIYNGGDLRELKNNCKNIAKELKRSISLNKKGVG
jgi:dephospho-CoA kinase